MAVQIPDPGTGNGQTGDNEYVFRKKVKDNFSDQTNAASRLVGIDTDQVPRVQDALKAVNKTYSGTKRSGDCNDLTPSDGKIYTTTDDMTNLPLGSGNFWFIETFEHSFESRHLVAGIYRQVATSAAQNGATERFIRTKSYEGVWREWKHEVTSKYAYQTTTASGANVVVDDTGKFMRSTSSERYKEILAPLELDDARYADAMALKPIVYRSTADADNPAYHYYSFSAEELGAYDPAFTLWLETETVTDTDGNVTEQPLAERQAEGININALLAMSHAIAIKQDKIIKALEARIEILEAK